MLEQFQDQESLFRPRVTRGGADWKTKVEFVSGTETKAGKNLYMGNRFILFVDVLNTFFSALSLRRLGRCQNKGQTEGWSSLGRPGSCPSVSGAACPQRASRTARSRSCRLWSSSPPGGCP